MFRLRTVCAAALLAGLAQAARAEIVDMHFADGPGGSPGHLEAYGPDVYLDDQIAFRTAAQGGDYDFDFTYDPTDPSANHGLTLVSGRLGSITDFSAFTATLTFTPSNVFQINLFLVEHAGVSTYTTGVYFTLVDDDGDIPASLPTTIDLANLDQANASFEIRRSGGVGLGYYNWGYGDASGTFGPLTETGGPTDGGGDPGSGDPSGGVPEPAGWALMILGFGGAGAALRRRGRYAASN